MESKCSFHFPFPIAGDAIVLWCPSFGILLLLNFHIVDKHTNFVSEKKTMC